MVENDGFLIDDRELYEIWISPVCADCKHLDTTKFKKCAAFDKIPDEIWEGKNPHRQPYPGDGGIQYEKFKL